MTTWWQFMNQPKQSCVNISINILGLIVFITHIWLYGRFYISEFTCFSFFSPNLCCDIRARKSYCDCIGYCDSGASENIGDIFYWAFRGTNSIAPSPVNLYCTYTIIISSDFSEVLNSWVSRSKKCLVKEWQYLVFFRYSLTTYIIPFFNADVWKKADKKRLFVVSLFLFSF